MLRKYTLEIDALAQPVHGRLHDEQGATRPFVGWLGLAEALAPAMEGARDPGAQAPEHSERA